MPIAYYQLHPWNENYPGYAVALELARQTVSVYSAVRGIGVGIGPGSCCAAVAIQAAPPYYPTAHQLLAFDTAPPYGPNSTVAQWGAPTGYAVVTGNSQIGMHYMAPDVLPGHAERVALYAAGGRPLYLLPAPAPANNAVLFVELAPCGMCQNWLNGAPAPPPNPYNGVINGGGPITLNVWWRWEYPAWPLPPVMHSVEPLGGVGGMNAFHQLPCSPELVQIDTQWQIS